MSNPVCMERKIKTDQGDTIPCYPEFIPLGISLQAEINNLLSRAGDGISEFTFADLYLFRKHYNYHVSVTSDGLLIISGWQQDQKFFMTPVGVPQSDVLKELFQYHDYWKNIPESLLHSEQETLEAAGISFDEDRDNFDYLYLRTDLSDLPGKKYHKKRNLIHAFSKEWDCEIKTLTEENIADALTVLDRWQENRTDDGDYEAAREALQLSTQLNLSGRIYYVDEKPVGWCLGETLARNSIYAVHFEKGLDEYKGIYQFINQNFAASLPDSIVYINREQDLGDEGLRQAKMTYRPTDFVKKYIGRKNIRP